MSNGSRTSNSTNNSNHNDNNNWTSFENFFNGWLVRQERILDELLLAQEHCNESRDEDTKDLITRVLAHYQQYYEEKSKMAQRNIFLLFSPPWFSSFERSFLWIGGFKPALAFRLVNESVNDLTEEQRRRITILTGDTRVEEKMLNDELAKIQESVAAPPIIELARRQGQLRGGEVTEEEEAMEILRSPLERMVANADLLRTTTAATMVEILNPAQNVKFLTAATQLQLRIRSWGLQKDGEREESE